MSVRARPCIDCGALSFRTRCARHQAIRNRERVAKRGTAHANGYGRAHQAERARRLHTYQPTDLCPRCGEPLGVDPRYIDLGHTDDRTAYSGLEHAYCNRSAGGKRAH